MSVSWMKTIIGYPQTDDGLKDIPNPGVELGIHITTKFVQVGSFLGGALIGPAIKLLVRNSDKKLRWSSRAGITGATIGLVIGPALTIAFISSKKLDYDALYDRCYRLRHNYWQLTYDRASYLGAVVGGLVLGRTGVPFGINLAAASVFVLHNGIELLRTSKSQPAAGESTKKQT